MKIHAVIGANFGDEGKGLMTDYLTHKHKAELVVRVNGGANAGHRVVCPDGRTHVFHHFGSGSFAGAETYLSKFFVCNPILFNEEYTELKALNALTTVHVDPLCMVTTPWDMMLNQAIEKHRGGGRHGSVGIGLGETMARHEQRDKNVHLSAGDLFNYTSIMDMIKFYFSDYLPKRAEQLELPPEALEGFRDKRIIDHFLHDCGTFIGRVEYRPAIHFQNAENVVFEGAQGLLLSQNCKEFFPHVSRAFTGLRNGLEVAKSMRATSMDACYVSRTYLTRHGAGKLPGEESWSRMDGTDKVFDNTNMDHPWQGRLRFAPFLPQEFMHRVTEDWDIALAEANLPWSFCSLSLALTHMDQIDGRFFLDEMRSSVRWHRTYTSYGPTREHVREA